MACDGRTERDQLHRELAPLHGTRPEATGHLSEQAEITAVVERIRIWSDQGVQPGEIAVCTRFHLLLGKVHDQLTAEGIPAVRVKDRPDRTTRACAWPPCTR